MVLIEREATASAWASASALPPPPPVDDDHPAVTRHHFAHWHQSADYSWKGLNYILSLSLRRTRRSYRCAGEGGGGGKGDHHLTMAHPPDAQRQCVSLTARNILSAGTEWWPAEAPAKQWTAALCFSLTLSLRHYGHQSLQSLICKHCVQRRCRAQQQPPQQPSSRLLRLCFAQRSLLQSQ